MNRYDKQCRACLKENEPFTYFLFENLSAKTFMFCTSIDVSEDDRLTKAVCNGCHELLTKFSHFKYVCLQAQETLASLSNKQPDISLEYGNNLLTGGGDSIFKLEDSDLNKEAHKTLASLSNKQQDRNLKYGDNLLNEGGDSIIKLEESDFNTKDGPQSDNFEEIDIIDDQLDKDNKRLEKVKKPQKRNPNAKGYFAYECEKCNKKFNHQNRFEAHKLLHEGKTTTINCLPCKKTFITWSGLYRHNENCHMKVDLHCVQCSVCGQVCKSRQTLKAHMKTHGKRSISICNVCGKEFTSNIVLKTHLETHTKNRERRFTCEHCGKKFFTNAILRCHITRCHTNKRFICDICTYPFTDKHNLSIHLLNHEGKRYSFTCEVCNKSYTCHSSLAEHKRIHTGERPFVCSYCPKSFRSKRRLLDHHRIHTGERPHKCNLCTQAFTQRGTLIRHMKVHNRKSLPAASTTT